MSRFERAAEAAKRRLREVSIRARGSGDGPLVTVVLIARGRAGFVGECLKSVLASSHRSLEVLLVAEPDDVDTRRALDALTLSARRVRRLRVEAGRSALDRAVEAATGEYLTFVDGDDVVSEAAYAWMVEVLAATGSDLVVGAQHRVRVAKDRGPTWAGVLFDEARLRQSLETCPQVLVDLSLTNKMFRLDSWRSAGLSVASWDRASSTVTHAYLAAKAFDVVTAVVSEVHARDVSLPIEEQARFNPEVAAARLESLREVARSVKERGGPLWDRWLVDAFEHLLPPMYVDAVGGGEAYFRLLSPVTRDLLIEMRPDLHPHVSVHARMTAWVAAQGSLADVALMQDLLADNPHGLPTRTSVTDDRSVAPPDGLSCNPPRALCRIEDVDRRLRTTVSNLVDDGVGSGWVEGAAFVEYVDSSGLPMLVLIDPSGTHRAPLETTSRVDLGIQEWAERAHEDRSAAGFAARWDLTTLEHGSGPWRLEVTREGRTATQLIDRVGRGPELDVALVLGDVRVSDGVLRIRGASSQRGLASGRLSGQRGDTEAVTVSREGELFTVEIPLRTDLFGESVALPAGRYLVELADESGHRPRTAWDSGLLDQLPEMVDGRLRVSVANGPRGAVAVVGSPLGPDERSAFHQQRLVSSVYSGPAISTYDRTVLLETFHGRSVGDNPGALGRELLSRGLGLDLVWVVDDPSVNVPPGTRAVARRSREWYDALGHARAYIGNAGAPYFFRKSPGQFHLQTWHGTPLKRIGEDRGPGDFNTWRHRRRIASQAAGWDALVSPSPYCSEIFRRAFGFEGRLLESGYPRNDILLSDRAESVRERVRAVLGLGPGERVVLYAPTWREYVGVRDAKPLYLDAELLTNQMPDAVVLVRGHYNSTGQADVFDHHPRIHDVTRYPDIADLYLAADVLVTDYSSVMFDFALTDKPIILLTPDLEQYRDVERGFYFDIEQRSAGPMVESTEHVIETLGRPDVYSVQRAAFRDEFCPFDDGAASQRVIDDMLARW